MRITKCQFASWTVAFQILGMAAWAPASWAQCTENIYGCVEQELHTALYLPCDIVSCNIPLIRGPSSGRGFPAKQSWVYQGFPEFEGPPQIFVDENQIRSALSAAITTWTSISDTLPQDDLWPNQFVAEAFTIRWRDIEQVGALAKTPPTYGNPPYRCRITNSIMDFAYNPRTATGTALGWDLCAVAHNCAPVTPTGPLAEIDFFVAAVHEFGHAYGLRHTCGDATATMSGTLSHSVASLQDTFAVTPTANERSLLRQMYRDNFTPATVDFFEVSQSNAQIQCTWASSVERDCAKYVVRKVCDDGRRYIVASDIPCHGTGLPYLITDSVPSSTAVAYELGVVLNTPGSLPEERIVALWEAAGSQLVQNTPRRSANHPTAAGHQHDSVESLLDVYGRAVSIGDYELVQSTLADGFAYQLGDGGWWGKRVERALHRRSNACFDSTGIRPDSLAIAPITVEAITPTLSRVVANVRYYRLPLLNLVQANASAMIDCTTHIGAWEGQVTLLVERPDALGWRIRRIVEPHLGILQ